MTRTRRIPLLKWNVWPENFGLPVAALGVIEAKDLLVAVTAAQARFGRDIIVTPANRDALLTERVDA